MPNLRRAQPSPVFLRRLNDLESKWSAIEGTLGEVLKELRDVKSTLHQPSQSRPGSSSGTGANHPFSPIPPSPQDYRSTTFSPHIDQTGPLRPHSHSFSSVHSAGGSGGQLPPIDQIYNGARLNSPFTSFNATTPISTDVPSSQTLPSIRRRAHLSTTNLYSANNSGDELEDLPNAALAAPISVVNGWSAAILPRNATR